MRETKLGIEYQVKESSGEYQQKIVFSSESSEGTTPSEVLNLLIEKLYFNQSRIFSCETATAIEFLKAARRIIVKQLVKSKV